MAKTSAILYSPDGVAPPDVVQRWLDALGVPIVTVNDADTLMGASLRSRPRVVVFDSRAPDERRARGAPAGEERLVHRCRARRRRLDERSRFLRRRVSVRAATR